MGAGAPCPFVPSSDVREGEPISCPLIDCAGGLSQSERTLAIRMRIPQRTGQGKAGMSCTDRRSSPGQGNGSLEVGDSLRRFAAGNEECSETPQSGGEMVVVRAECGLGNC